MAWRMSQQQQENLAWIMRGLNILGLSLATWLGGRVYQKVEDIHKLVIIHEVEINQLKKDSEKQEKENEKTKTEYAILRENYYEIKARLAAREGH